MKRKTKFVILCLLFLILNGCSSQRARSAYTPPGSEFSFVPPEHWVMRQVPGYKYQFAFGPKQNNFSPNINFVDENAPITLDDYVTGNLQALEQMAKDESRSLKILTQEGFTTDFKRSGTRVVTETEHEGNPIRQTFYFFEGKDQIKFVITCSTPGEAGQNYDKICDSSIRTFKPSGD